MSFLRSILLYAFVLLSFLSDDTVVEGRLGKAKRRFQMPISAESHALSIPSKDTPLHRKLKGPGLLDPSIPVVSRSLGGGIPNTKRSLYQEWARDDDGKLLWWIWVIIGCSIGLCCFVCCCTSACCLRD